MSGYIYIKSTASFHCLDHSRFALAVSGKPELYTTKISQVDVMRFIFITVFSQVPFCSPPEALHTFIVGNRCVKRFIA